MKYSEAVCDLIHLRRRVSGSQQTWVHAAPVLTGKTGSKSLTCPTQQALISQLGYYTTVCVCVSATGAFLQLHGFVSFPHSRLVLKPPVIAADTQPTGCVFLLRGQQERHSSPVKTHRSPPRSFVVDVLCQQTGRLTGW